MTKQSEPSVAVAVVTNDSTTPAVQTDDLTEVQERPIVFLDVDGPLIPLRMYWHPDNHRRLAKTFDPAAVMMIQEVAALANAQFVVSSTWRLRGYERCVIELFERNGFDLGRFHDDWSTTLTYHTGLRHDEIQLWLNRHPEVKHWVAIDDESFPEPYEKHLVHTTMDDGFLFSHYQKLKRLLGVKESSLIIPDGQKS